MRRIVACLVACATIALASLTVTVLRAGDLPKVPENVRELLQDRKYDDAAAAIDMLLAVQPDKPKNPDYLLYLKGRALHLASKHREALETFARLERDYADSPWVRRARFGQAAALLKLGDFDAAEQIYEDEVKLLLSAERKHEIASIYLEFADAYFDPPKKAGDGASVSEKKPDYAKALNFYRQALGVGPQAERRTEVEFRIARCQQELGQHAEGVAAYQAYLKAHPTSKADIEARYQLGTAQLALGQNAEARRTWKDLLDAHADHKLESLNELRDAYPNRDTQRLAEAAYGMSHTYGLPNPPSKEDLELGVAAADRFIANFPDIKLAARSAFEIAQGFVSQNRHDEASDRLRKLLSNPKYAAAEVIPDARVLLGFVYQRQKKFPEAIGQWQEYLARHAAHPSWSQVQQAIIDTEFLTALEMRREGSRHSTAGDKKNWEDWEKSYVEARRLWTAFLDRYPLDPRAASIVLEFGLMNFEIGELAAKDVAGDAAGQKAAPLTENDRDTERPKPDAGTAPSAFQAAMADWTRLVSKYPNTEEASRGQYLIGMTYEEKLGKFDEALAAYRKLTWGQFAPRAAERITRLTRQELAMETERVFRTNQQPRIRVTTRNVRQLTVKAYRVDLETYFRKMHLARGIESLDVALIDPEKTWTFDVPDYADYKQLTSRIDIPLDAPGVMAVTVANEAIPLGQAAGMSHLMLRPQEATTMVMRSDLDILVKCSRNELFVFAENMRTGKPFAGVKLLVSDGTKVFAEATTGDDGVFVGSVSDTDKTWEPLKASNDIRVFALTQDAQAKEANEQANSTHFASNVIGLKGVEFAQGVSSKGYIYTERPTYRPGQLVHVRGVVRWVKGDEYFFDAGKKFKLDVYDSRGRQIRSEEVTLGEFGSFATHLALPAEAPQGEYRLHAHDPAEPDKHNYQGTFAVHEYQLQPVLIEIDTPQKVYYRGDQVSGTIKLKYYYGSPVAEREIRYVLPDGTIHNEMTNAAGEVAFKFDTREFREDQMLAIVVQYPELNLRAGLNLFLSTHGFRATIATARDVYLAGETFDVTVSTADAAGKKIAEKLTLAVVERTEVLGQVGERTVEEQRVATDKDSGSGRATIKIAGAGTYILRATGTDRFGNPVSAEHTVTVSGNEDTVRLRILSDRHHYKAGDTATVQVHWREQPALAMVTYQGARVLGYRLVELAKGSNKLEIPITEKLAPNFDLTVSVMSDSGGERRQNISATLPRGEPARNVNAPQPPILPEPQPECDSGIDEVPPADAAGDAGQAGPLPSFHEASSPFEVERPLVVTIKPNRDRVLPGEDVEVAISATDPQGRPVRAELSLAMVEKSLLEMFPDQLAAIAQFFEGSRRTSALDTVASCTFRYEPATRDISQTLLAEAERAAVADMERLSRDRAIIGDVDAKALDQLGVVILRGNAQDVEEMRARIEAARSSAFGYFKGEKSGGGRYSVVGGAEGFGPGGQGRVLEKENLPARMESGTKWFRNGKFSEAELAARQALEQDKSKLKSALRGQSLSKAGGRDSLYDVDESAIPFGDDELSIKYLDVRRWDDLTESRNILKQYQLNAQQLRGYASVLAGDSQRTAGKNAQLGVLLSDGSVNFLDAAKVAAGKARNLPTGANVVVLPESQMRETGYWNPAIVTDEGGKATVTITVPGRSTAWQLAARGITVGTLTGQATADLIAKKDLFGELKLPIAFVDGDSAQILATIHNDAVANGKIEVGLKTTIAGKSRDEKRTIDVSKRGTHELVFDREIAGTGEAVFELNVRVAGAESAKPRPGSNGSGDNRGVEDSSPAQSDATQDKAGIAPEGISDSLSAIVPIRPYGVPVFTTTGGSASSNMTSWVSPPAGMPVRDPSLQIVIGPSVERSLLDVVLAPTGSLGYLECHRVISGESALERTTSDLMASLGLMKLIGESRETGSPESTALADRIRSSIGYLISSQNDDGGWHWSAARGAKQGSSDRNATARALWALSLARKAAFAVPDDAFNKAITFAQSAFTTARENDYDGKALLLHALSAAGRGDFAYANRLYRSRTSLSRTALAYLSLAFVEMDRKEIARELLDLLAPKLAEVARIETANGSVGRAAPAGPRPQGVPPAEVQALYLHGLNATAHGDRKLKDTADWLLAHRAGSRWQPERATGPATLALAEYFATARFAAEHYKLKVFVNDHEVAALDIDGAGGSRVVDVPKEVLARGEKLPEKDFSPDAKKQRINFELTGRGRFTFNCVYSGFVAADQLKNTVNAYHIERHYEPAPLELDGKEIPRGFDIVDGPITTWRNPVTELPVGRRAQVLLNYYPINGHQIPEDEREYVVITEPIPSGCSVLEKSITGQFDRYEVGPGYITFYVGNRIEANEIRFDLYGYTAGKYRTAPTIVRNFYDPERMMVTQPHPLTVLATGHKSKDEYRVTPRELYELGKRNVQKALASKQPATKQPAEAEHQPANVASYATAGKYLTELFDKFQVKADIYKEVTQMLFEVSLAVGKAPDIVRYFEVLKEKWPDLEVAFDQIVRVGAAYRELNEYERSYLVFRATVEGSFVRESQIGGFLESQGEFERSITVMDRILREYPAEPYIASATYALAQRVYAMAPNAAGDSKLRERKTTKVDLIRDAVGRLDDFLTVWPDDPAADQASFSLASALIELEAWPAAIARANRFAERFPNSEYLDSFWYIVGYSHFARGEHRAALDMCRRVAEATYTEPTTGRAIESRNKWRAIYISGQVHHSLGEPAEAIAEYNRVADRFPDAKETIAYFTRKAIDLPEITAVKPPSKSKLDPGAATAAQDGDRAADGQQPDDHAGTEVELKFRNVASCEVKVYRIDLLKFGLLHRDLANVTKINLAGIQPLYEAKIELGDGKDFRDRIKKLELPLQDEGAYLVVCRGEDLHTSGLVLVTPLVVEVQEEASSGRVRATVKNSVTDAYAADVHVKVIGTRNDKFKDGPTDLRGVFVADGIQGRATVIARAGAGQYAFHRGQQELGSPPAAATKPAAEAAPAADPGQPAGQQQLLEDLIQGNRMIQQQKGKELKELYEKKPMGVPAQQAF